MKASHSYEIREFLTDKGQNPFQTWLSTLDSSMRARVQARIFRFELGNLGDYKAVSQGVYEARLDFGPGYRIYFGIDRSSTIILLMGGDKGQQSHDIRKAQEYWINYERRKNYGTKKQGLE